MSIATVSSKGQITLPSEARRATGICAHDRVWVRVSAGTIVIEPVADFMALKGVLGDALPALAEEEAMEHAAADHVLEHR